MDVVSLVETKLMNARLSHPKYRPDIDGLRSVAVLSVVTFHAFPEWMPGGFIGVDIFFVISGYLISTIIFDNLRKGTFSFVEFYARRIRRIFPALILVLFSTLLFGWLVLLPDELNQLGKHAAAGAGFYSNFALWQEAGYFDKSSDAKPLLHLWSLAIEEQFYIIWPFVLWIGWKGRINLFIVIALIGSISFYLNVAGVNTDSVASFYSPQTRFWELLCGSALAWHSINGSEKYFYGLPESKKWIIDFIHTNRTIIMNVFSISGLIFLTFGFWKITTDMKFPGGWAVVPVLGSVLIIWACPVAWFNRVVLSNRLFVWFGLISFPLYLWHWPILSFARIIEGGVPSRDIRIAAVSLAIFLAWMTFEFIEKPVRFGNIYPKFKVSLLSGLMIFLAMIGLGVSKMDFSETNGFENLTVRRKGSDFAFGQSLAWYKGQNDWMFLGNAYHNTVEKIKHAKQPTELELDEIKTVFSKLSESASKYGIATFLIIGPDKSSVYPEHLPEKLVPSSTRYLSFFLEKLKSVPSLIVYDPTDDLLAAKGTDGLLYWRTDTHWNLKGAFLTYAGFCKIMNVPVPDVDFIQGSTHKGDLIEISGLKDFPVHADDNWDVVWKSTPDWVEKELPIDRNNSFAKSTIVNNTSPLSDKYVWVVGDSFSIAMKQYFNATFKQVRYVGHWADTLSALPEEIERVERKPDLIVVIRVERTF